MTDNRRPTLRVLAHTPGCSVGECPTVWESEASSGQATDDVLVQGYVVTVGPAQQTVTGVQVPEGEAIVRIPQEVLLDAAKRILCARGRAAHEAWLDLPPRPRWRVPACDECRDRPAAWRHARLGKHLCPGCVGILGVTGHAMLWIGDPASVGDTP